MSNQLKGILYALVTAFLWGILAVALKVALKQVDTLTITWFRFASSFTVLLVYYAIKSPASIRILYQPPPLLILAAIGLSLNYYGFIEGVNLSGPRVTQVVIQFGPVTLTIAGILFFKERFRGLQGLGILILFTGMALFFKENLELLTNTTNDFIKGVMLVFMAAIAWATYGISQKILVRTYPVQKMNLFLYGFSALCYTFIADFSVFTKLSLEMWGLLIFLGLNTLVAYGALGMALKHADAGKVSVIIATNPVVTFVFIGILELLNIRIEALKLPFIAYAGAFLVIAGAVISVRKPKSAK